MFAPAGDAGRAGPGRHRTLPKRAIAVKPSDYQQLYPFFLFVQGLAEYRQGRFDRAISTMRGDASRVLGPGPRLVLAMAQHRSGQIAEARKTLAEAVVAHDWRANQVSDQNDWIFHVLRREAERMILPGLPRFLADEYQPRDNDERLALLGVCQFKNRTRTLARLYADAFATLPELATNVEAGHCHNAARAAALAGNGCGEDAGNLSPEERTRWRRQALAWLTMDLATCTRKLNSGIAGDRPGSAIGNAGWLAVVTSLESASETRSVHCPPKNGTSTAPLDEGGCSSPPSRQKLTHEHPKIDKPTDPPALNERFDNPVSVIDERPSHPIKPLGPGGGV